MRDTEEVASIIVTTALQVTTVVPMRTKDMAIGIVREDKDFKSILVATSTQLQAEMLGVDLRIVRMKAETRLSRKWHKLRNGAHDKSVYNIKGLMN